MSTTGFLGVPVATAEAQRLFDDDISELGYVMNGSKLWAYQPTTYDGLFGLIRETSRMNQLTHRQRCILIAACASAFGDSYCSLVWGSKLADVTNAQTAFAVLCGDDEGLTTSESAMADWARQVAREPNQTCAADVQALRDTGYDDAQIFGITVFVALRIALSTVNDALGARPDAALCSTVPQAVLDAVTFGRPIDDETPDISHH